MSPGRRSELAALQRRAGVQEKRKLVEERVEQVEESNVREGEIKTLLEQRRRLSEERAEMARKIKEASHSRAALASSVASYSSKDSVQDSVYSNVSAESFGSGSPRSDSGWQLR